MADVEDHMTDAEAHMMFASRTAPANTVSIFFEILLLFGRSCGLEAQERLELVL